MLPDAVLRGGALVRAGLQRRHADPELFHALEQWQQLDTWRRGAANQLDALLRARPPIAERGNTAAIEAQRAHEAAIQEVRHTLEEVRTTMCALAARLPNLPDARVPDGAGPPENVVMREQGKRPQFALTPRPHDALAAALGLFDGPRAGKVAGTRFPLLVGVGARLARALAALMLDLHRESGYVEVAPPHLVRAEALEGTGHLPHFARELYTLPEDGLSLSPTTEVQLLAQHAGETLDEAELPLRYTAWAPAFRREAGSAGAAARGLLRQHQFEKVELVRIAPPEAADAAFEEILSGAEAVLRRLELAYRVVMLCAAELPFAAARTYDLEVWLPSLNRYVEVSSISDCATYQARGLNLRYRPAGSGRPRFPHTLNGTALAIGRTLAALLEQRQRADGSVALPEALAPYLSERELCPPSSTETSS
jgi:seryl-tRNA synthetase